MATIRKDRFEAYPHQLVTNVKYGHIIVNIILAGRRDDTFTSTKHCASEEIHRSFIIANSSNPSIDYVNSSFPYSYSIIQSYRLNAV
jgi:hypothetical protein